MEWNGRRILVWNMEDAQTGMKDGPPYFHTNYIYSIYQNVLQIAKYYQTRMRIIIHFSVLQREFLPCCDYIVLLR